MGGADGQARDRVAAAAPAAGIWIWVPPPVDASLQLPLLPARLHSRETLLRLLPRLQGLLQGEKPQLRHVCGVELSLRPQRDCLAVWNIKGGHSSFIKSMRGSDPDAALYYMARMLEAGDDPLFLTRRMIIFAAEDGYAYREKGRRLFHIYAPGQPRYNAWRFYGYRRSLVV